ncbi:MAG: hypothetical protein V3W41_22225 [Planctomycetota bacterium]
MTDEEIAKTVRRLARCQAAIDRMKDFREALQQRLVSHMGDATSIDGDWGSFSYPWRDGRVRWRELYLKQVGGVTSGPEIERYRGARWREARLYLNDSVPPTNEDNKT